MVLPNAFCGSWKGVVWLRGGYTWEDKGGEVCELLVVDASEPLLSLARNIALVALAHLGGFPSLFHKAHL